jgi:hypothetical protein
VFCRVFFRIGTRQNPPSPSSRRPRHFFLLRVDSACRVPDKKHSVKNCVPSKFKPSELYWGWHSANLLPSVFWASTRQTSYVPWVLKHRAMSSLDPSGKEMWFGKRHSVVAIHPDCAVVFLFDARRQRLLAYDMDHGTTCAVHTFTNASSRKHLFFPYVPLYSQ